MLRHGLRILVLLLVAAPAAGQPVIAPFHADGIYAVGERVGWTVTLPAGTPVPEGGYHYVVRSNNTDTKSRGAERLVLHGDVPPYSATPGVFEDAIPA